MPGRSMSLCRLKLSGIIKTEGWFVFVFVFGL